jgi:hypothetical protein
MNTLIKFSVVSAGGLLVGPVEQLRRNAGVAPK